MAEYVQKLQPGAAVTVTCPHRRPSVVFGVLVKATDQLIVVQTNLPEPGIEIPLDDTLKVTVDSPYGIGRSIALGAVQTAVVMVGLLFAYWSQVDH